MTLFPDPQEKHLAVLKEEQQEDKGEHKFPSPPKRKQCC